MNKEQPTPTQRVEQLRDKIARSTDDIPPNAVALVNLALQLATELEAAQKDLEMRAIRDDGQCDLIANLRQQLADKTRECEAEQFGASKLLKQNDQLRAENTELKKDKERLDWLEKHRYSYIYETFCYHPSLAAPNWRTAIDAARKEQG